MELVQALQDRLALRGQSDQVREELRGLLPQIASFPLVLEHRGEEGEDTFTLQDDGEGWFTSPWCRSQGRCECTEGQERESCHYLSAEEFLYALLSYLLEEVDILKGTITQRNNLARALRAALAHRA